VFSRDLVNIFESDSETWNRVWLTRRGTNVWYDEGIPAGTRWSDALAVGLLSAQRQILSALNG